MKYIFDETVPTPLCEIMGRHGSDKGHLNIKNSWHNYTTLYYQLFFPFIEDNLRIFELGLGTNNVNVPSNMGVNGKPGASLYGWREFFPYAEIFGADIDSDILFTSERIQTFFCDQTDPDSIRNLWNRSELHTNFDIIIEDGLHTFDANVCFFENSIHKLNKDGFYIIEDITEKEYHLFVEKIKDWEIKYTDCTFTLQTIPCLANNTDNTLLIVHKNK